MISVCASHLSEKRSYKPLDDFDVTKENLVTQIRARELATYRNDQNRITSDFSAEDETRRDYGGRFLWELLQNADDAMGREARTSADLIGSKGLGFKAILEIGDEPELHSKDFNFRFSVSDTRAFLSSNEISDDPPPLTFRIPHDCPPNRGGPRESDSCDRWDPAFMRRISGYGEATEFFGGLQGESCA